MPEVPFIQNSNQMASSLTATTSFPRVFFQLLQYLRQHPRFSPHRAPLMTKTYLTSPAFSSRFADFGASFSFRDKFSSTSFPGSLFSASLGRWSGRQRREPLGTRLSFHSTRSDARARFGGGVIFLNQSEFFATHSNQ